MNAYMNGSRPAEIILIDNIVSVYRSGSDVTMHVIGSSFEVRSSCRLQVYV